MCDSGFCVMLFVSCCSLKNIICNYIWIYWVCDYLQAALLLGVWFKWFSGWNGFGSFERICLVVFDGAGAEILCWWVVFMDFVMNCLWFWLCSNFLSGFLLGCCCCYRPLVSGSAMALKLFEIKIPFKTAILWVCWNYLWCRCWRLFGKCVRFGFFAADTATKQPKWLIRKCYSTAL